MPAAPFIGGFLDGHALLDAESDYAQANTYIKDIVGTGAYVRSDCGWNRGGAYAVDIYDHSTTAPPKIATWAASIRSYGLVPLLIVVPSTGFSGSGNVTQFASDLAFLVAQTGCQGLNIEIMNEPDQNGCTGTTGAALYMASYGPMKSADPTCTVVVGVTANENPGGSGDNYWAAAIAAGMTQSYGDVCSMHFYESAIAGPNYGNSTDPTIITDENEGMAAYISSSISRWRSLYWSTKPIWITEWGFQWQTTDNIMNVTLQAEYCVKMLDIFQALPEIPTVITQYMLTDGGNAPDIDWGAISTYSTVSPLPPSTAHPMYTSVKSWYGAFSGSPPTITGVNPNVGTANGGTVVSLTGTNFTGATAVKFGTTNAASFTVNSSTSITATSPSGSVGTVNITVTTSGGTSTTSGADDFTFTPPIPTPYPTPSSTPPYRFASNGGGRIRLNA